MALNDAIKSIEKDYGNGSIMKLGENKNVDIESISTGCMTIDRCIGPILGIPRGRITEIFGVESSGKTTLALHTISEAQKQGGVCAFIDMEHALDPVYCKNIGVDIDNLYISQPNTGEEAIDICERLVSSNEVDVVVVDSVASLLPKAEAEGNIGDSHMGLQARLMAQAMRKLVPAAYDSKCAVIFINQIREKIGVIYGSNETRPGGRALRQAASLIIDIRKGEQLKESGEAYGSKTKIKIIKNKVGGAPFKTCEVDMIFGKGISKIDSLLTCATEVGVTTRSGAHYHYGDIKLGNGRAAAQKTLSEDDKLREEIEKKVRKCL